MILDIEFTEVEQSFDANFGEVQIVSDGSGTGENGGYYLPNVSDEGTLSWTPSKDNMPGVKAVNIKGEPGKDGYTPIKGVDYFDGAPGEKGDKGDRGEPGKDAEPYTLPTATETTKGGVIVGDGLTIDGDVLSVKSGEYELIETITLAEDSTLERTAEPDGTPYNFDAVYIQITSTLENFNGFNLYTHYDNEKVYPVWVEKYGGNTVLSTKVAYIEIAKQYGLYHALYRTHATNNYISNIQESVIADASGRIKAIRVANVASAGTRFNIWGVRADA